MGLAPAEIDVFSRPHSRIKRLVDNYSQKMSATDFSNYSSLKAFLGSLRLTFKEFKTHESIENECIMEKLKNRLDYHKVRVSEVAEVHSDDCLGKMKRLVEDGWAKTDTCSSLEMAVIGNQLAEALTKFTEDFLPHMKEEEEIFQPLLMKYFTYDELREIRGNVIRQHSLFMTHDDTWEEKSDQEVECQDKLVEDLVPAPIQLLPSEVTLKIFSHLGPRDLSQCQQACSQWSTLARDSTLWRTIYPVKWAQGDWRFNIPEDELETGEDSPPPYKIDEDADIDESESSGESDGSESSSRQSFRQIRKETKIVLGLVKHLLPAVGRGVEVLNVAGSKGVTSGMVYKMLQHTPNVRHLNLSSTMVSDVAFKGLSRHNSCSKLEHLDLSGCANITDLTLERLAEAFRCRKNSSDGEHRQSNVKVDKNGKQKRDEVLADASSSGTRKTCPKCGSTRNAEIETIAQRETCPPRESPRSGRAEGQTETRTLKYLSLSGCYRITDDGLRALREAGPYPHLGHLDLSGCLNVTALGLSDLVKFCESLDHQEFFYCDNILEGPYAQTASGCQNLQCNNRVCCRSGE